MEARTFDLPRYLSVLPLFTDLNRPELERLALGCQLRRLSRGDTVFRVGEACEEFHVTVTGQVKLYALSPAGQEKVIELVGPGNSFAEALMFTGKPYIVNAQALTDTLLLTVKGGWSARSSATRASRCACWPASRAPPARPGARRRGLRAAQRHAARDRLPAARPVVEDCATGEVVTVSLPVSKATIASRLSLTPEYFSRVLHELEAAGRCASTSATCILDPRAWPTIPAADCCPRPRCNEAAPRGHPA